MDKERETILNKKHRKEIDLRKNKDNKSMEKRFKVDMELDDLAKLMMQEKKDN
ncbi:hypothetical protein HDR60_03965 [bacterium]|nr:hypothetical protein [bacterium]